ncbi:MAG: rcc01693 family protein [Gemmobacter sp.]|uniref:rcc01693 family protein n=1 Tax=Gemmobacter sp. TaxID=1898957 RepID=UPI00391BC52D
MRRIDWAGLMRAGLGPPSAGGLGLTPAAFWALRPVELRIMLGLGAESAPVGRARLEALMAAFPDRRTGGGDGGA